MLVSSIYKSLCRSRLLCCGGALASLSNNLSNSRSADDVVWKKSDVFVTSQKNYSTETRTPSVALPPLCDFPIAIWPKIINSFRNFLTFNMVIKGRLDREFNEEDFVNATKQALYVVSGALASENYDQLEGLVTPQVIEHSRGKISTLSNEQKQCIAVQDDDMYFSYPHSVQVLNEGDKSRERTFVEIMMVFHYMRGLGRMKRAGQAIPINMWGTQAEQIFIANYRFIREYTENVDSSWIINVVNHFTPHLAQQQQQ